MKKYFNSILTSPKLVIIMTTIALMLFLSACKGTTEVNSSSASSETCSSLIAIQEEKLENKADNSTEPINSTSSVEEKESESSSVSSQTTSEAGATEPIITPDLKPSATPKPEVIITPTPTAVPTPEPTVEPTPVATATPGPTATPMPVVTQAPVSESTPTPTPLPTNPPTPTVLSDAEIAQIVAAGNDALGDRYWAEANSYSTNENVSTVNKTYEQVYNEVMALVAVTYPVGRVFNIGTTIIVAYSF